MKIYITEENFNIKNHTPNEIINSLINHIYVHLKKYEVKEVVTNSYIATILVENNRFIKTSNTDRVTLNNGVYDNYIIGTIYGISVYVNPNMKWMDDIITPIYNIPDIRKNKLHKILNKEYKDVLEEIVIDKKIGDMLF